LNGVSSANLRSIQTSAAGRGSGRSHHVAWLGTEELRRDGPGVEAWDTNRSRDLPKGLLYLLDVLRNNKLNELLKLRELRGDELQHLLQLLELILL